ncbi:MAG: hypothetical protein R3C15_05470 [Thermoleophilia bacterium]
MDDATRAVEQRLERIDGMRARGGSSAALLAELRALLGEAERWAASDAAGSTRARAAVDALGVALGPAAASTVDRRDGHGTAREPP